MSHPNIQQLLAAIWYEGVPGFRRKSSSEKLMIIVGVALLFPFYCLLYIFAPETRTGKLMRKPFMKFLIHASSYLFFLCKYKLSLISWLEILKVKKTTDTSWFFLLDSRKRILYFVKFKNPCENLLHKESHTSRNIIYLWDN